VNPRRVFRSADDRWIAGVAAGVAEYFDVDPILVRIVWIISCVPLVFLPVLAYVIMVVVVPLAPQEWPEPSPWQPRRRAARIQRHVHSACRPCGRRNDSPVRPLRPAQPPRRRPPVRSPELQELPRVRCPPSLGSVPGGDWRWQTRADRWQRKAERPERRGERHGSGGVVSGAADRDRRPDRLARDRTRSSI